MAKAIPTTNELAAQVDSINRALSGLAVSVDAILTRLERLESGRTPTEPPTWPTNAT